jgi:hypothetical protein
MLLEELTYSLLLQEFKPPADIKDDPEDCMQDLEIDCVQDENMEDEDYKESFSCSEHAYSSGK